MENIDKDQIKDDEKYEKYEIKNKIDQCIKESIKQNIQTGFKIEFNNHNDWYNFIYENDKTILALSSENKKINEVEYLLFEEYQTNKFLFKSTRISWKHSEEERNFLNMIYNKNFN